MVVPMMIRSPESTKFTEARTISNAAPSAKITSFLLNRLLIHWRTLAGITCFRNSLMLVARRTIVRAKADEPNISSPSSWRAKSTEVLITFFAFLEVARAYTITMPEAKRNMIGVCADDASEDIMKSCMPAPPELAT